MSRRCKGWLLGIAFGLVGCDTSSSDDRPTVPDGAVSMPQEDSGTADAASRDGGALLDAGHPDTGTRADSGALPMDGGSSDAGMRVPDGGVAMRDASTPDAEAFDSGFFDGGFPDSGAIPDAGGRSDSGVSPDAGGSVVPADMQALLDLMNQARAATGSGPMAWNAGVAQTALDWAQQCMWQHAPRSQRQYQGQTLGENLSATTNLSAPAENLGEGWIDEIQFWNCAANTCAPNEVCGHYTQVIWRSSVEVGCAVVNCSTGSPFGSPTWRYLVCRYLPAGNIIGRRPIPASDCP